MSKSKHVKVVIRTRPTSDFAQDIISFGPDRKWLTGDDDIQNKSVHIHIPKNEEGGYINNQQENWDFRFDNILHNASQEAVYEECTVPIIKGLLEGYNGTIMAYGQTGAGKTFTMTGATENYKHRGLIPRAISQIFREMADRPQLAFNIRISYLEIYNEQMVDLLAGLPDSTGSAIQPSEADLHVVEDKNGSAYVKGLTMQLATNEEEALNLLFEGETNRSISEHQLNKNSSRSHCVFTIYVESRSRVESSEKVIVSKLNLVDLAGSERLSKTETTGKSLKEAMYINKSLTFLEQVIIALADKKREHIPYRQSKMTNVLRDALGGNCNTLMIACIWGEKEHMEETISTLRFATRMMCVANTPEVNIQYDPMALIKKYEREIRELKQELSMHDTLSNRSHVQYEPYNETQRYELRKQVKAYLDNEEEELEVINLRHIKEIFNQFRVLYKTLETESEDWARIHKGALAGAAVTKDEGTETASGAAVRSAEPDKDDGVGDVEGSGFGVGLAPNGARPTGGMAMAAGRAGRDKRGRKRSMIPQTTPHGSAFQPPEEDETIREVQPSPLERDVTSPPPTRPEPIVILPDPTQLPPLPTQQTKARLMAPPPSRAEEFESFKRGKGAEINRILNENKAVLREKKRQAKDLAEAVNDAKQHIDKLKENIDRKKHERTTGAPTDTPPENIVIDEEEYKFLNQLRDLKQQYREQFDQLRHTRTDIEYCTRLVDQCRQKLMAEFEGWYETLYGAQMTEMDAGGGQVEDMMDIGEKFDRLQMERMSQEDPDSVPFYNARKNTERRYQKATKTLSPIRQVRTKAR
ncbi:Kinesin-like protein kif9 [Borealophlyctis nickersoniae]|nr:Kinesin-like protein kif9 [Borealophlyctis nickersoniae]